MIEGLVAVGAFCAYGYYRKRKVKQEFDRFASFVEKVTFQNVPFQKRRELDFDIFFYQEDKFSLEIWQKENTFVLYINDDEIDKHVFRIEKNGNDIKVLQPTISYYRTMFENKKKLFQSFISRYIGEEFESASTEQPTEILQQEIKKQEEINEFPIEIQVGVKEIHEQYTRISKKTDQLDIEDFTLIEALIGKDLKTILSTYRELSEDSQEKFLDDVLKGLEGIKKRLKRIEDKLESEKEWELKKSLRVLKERDE